MVGALSEREALGSQFSCEAKASAQIERFVRFDSDQLFPNRGSARHHYVGLPRENCSTTHRKCSRFQVGSPLKSPRSAQSSDRSRCRSGHPDSPPMPHIFCSCSSLMHESKDAATWIGRRGGGPENHCAGYPIQGLGFTVGDDTRHLTAVCRRAFRSGGGYMTKAFKKGITFLESNLR